ncbi:hypothetical protein BJ742DRAFT_796650 [Cladochytrium replicatum]|nr:hypothetical protein BJ742DRAFT_796650 [Cladochytrium replicatum]
MAPLDYTVIDAFTTERFRGNPAAVILFAGSEFPDDDLLRKLTKEFNLSETAFIVAHPSSTPSRPAFYLRWKTPDGEDVSLCGHATLATAHFLFTKHFASRIAEIDAIDLYTVKSGVLTVSLPKGQDIAGTGVDFSPAISMDFPQIIATRLHEESVDVVEHILAAFAGKAGGEHIRAEDIDYVGRTYNGVVVIVNERVDISKLEQINYNTLGKIDTFIIILSSRTPSSFSVPVHSPVTGEAVIPDYVVRVFAPSGGINEDPVTGAAQTTLSPYWTENRVNGKTVGDKLVGYQAFPGRGGVIQTLWDKERERVILTGRAKTVMSGVVYF